MTAVHFPTLAPPPARSEPHIPWITGMVVLLSLFAAANWSWDSSQRWSGSSEAVVAELVDRVAEGNSSRQVAFILFGIYGMCLCAIPPARVPRAKLRAMYPIVLFVGWAFLSAAWSVDRSQTAKRLVIFAAMILNVVGFIRHYDAKQLAQIALITSGLTMVVGIGNEIRIIVLDHPDFGLYRFGGMMHPNHAGLNAIVTLLASQYLFCLTRRRALLLVFAIAAIILFFTRSRTALMSGLTGVIALAVLTSPPRRLVWTLLAVTWLGAGAAWLSSMELMPSVVGLTAMGRSDVKHQDVTKLTGRTDIWKFAIMQADKDPNREFIGYGYETFWTPQNTRGVSDFVKFNISEGHCIYLDWYLELGLVGIVLYGIILVTAILRWTIASRTLKSPTCAVAAAILFATVVHGFAESSLGDASLPTLFVYLTLAGSGLMRPDEEEAV